MAETDAALTASGTLTSNDVDNPDNTFTPSATTGAIGAFAIDAAGAWTFTANNAFDHLNTADSVTETYNVTSIDGTPSTVTITITGTNDAAVAARRHQRWPRPTRRRHQRRPSSDVDDPNTSLRRARRRRDRQLAIDADGG